MKLNRRALVIGFILLSAAIIGLKKTREQALPAGQITEIDRTELTETTPGAISGRPIVEVITSKGKFTLELRPDISPEGVINFLNKWSAGYCNGMSFHRVENWVVQGCDPKGDGTGGENTLKTENSTEFFLTGSVGVARKPYPKNLSNDSQFFIVKEDSRFLDGEYTYLGRVTGGMDIINQISQGDVILSTTILTK